MTVSIPQNPAPSLANGETDPAVFVEQIDLDGLTRGLMHLGIWGGATVTEMIEALRQLPPEAVSTGQLSGGAQVSLAFYAPADLDRVMAMCHRPGHEYIREAIGAYRVRRSFEGRTDGAA